MSAQTHLLALFLLLLTTGTPALDAKTEEKPGEIPVAEPMAITHIYCDADGESHFAIMTLPFTLVEFAPPAPPISVTEALAGESVTIISSPPGWSGDWHPAPTRQLMFLLSGMLEVEVTDGEVQRFTAGATILVEDTACRGHVSRVVGNNHVFMANMPLSLE